MEKNNVIAVVLSFLVLAGSMFVQTKIIMPRQKAAMEAQAKEQQLRKAEEEARAAEENSLISSAKKEIRTENGIEIAAEIPEAEYEITTNKVKVRFTNKGGDIISYKLLEHKDKDTGDGVEMADGITPRNRAFSLGFGNSELVLNETFSTVKKDNNTILFIRDFDIKDENGNTNRFTLGKRYTFLPDDYTFKLDISIYSEDGKEINLNGSAYNIRTSPQIGPHFTKKDRYEVRQYISYGQKKLKKNIANKTYNESYSWAGVGGKYFTLLVKPESAEKMIPVTKTSAIQTGDQTDSQVFLTRKAGANINDTYYIYIGPRNERDLIKYNDINKNGWKIGQANFNQALNTSGLLSWIEIALKWCLEMINRLTKNWGVSIIVLTVILKLMLFPLNKNQVEGSYKMKKIQPRLQEIQKKYAGDQQKITLESQKLYKEVGYNPVSGCLPMVFQMVILFTLYNVFNNYFEFRGASFISGWIDDLSSGDSIWQWNREIPFLSGFTMNNLRLLPFIYTISQLVNGKISQYNTPAGANQSQMKFMMYGMPLMFFFLFYNVPSGLLLYWSVSNLLQVVQQIFMNSYSKKKAAEWEKAHPASKNESKFKNGKKKTR